MNISVVVIGRNSQVFLKQCLDSIEVAISLASTIINKFEIIYVDGNSSDNSIEIAHNYSSVSVVHIQKSTIFSASLGRYLGTKHAQYPNLLYMDSDMTLYQNWFYESSEFFNKYKAIIGKWTQINLFKDGTVKEVISNFNKIQNLSFTKKPCGFLQLSLVGLEDLPTFHPLIVNNEEKDFYAQFYKRRKIFCVPIDAFSHYNLKQNAKVKLKSYFSAYGKTGYLVSAYYAMVKGYSGSYAFIQIYKLLNIVFILIVIISLIYRNSKLLWIAAPILLFPFSRIKSRFFDILFFPYKLLFTIRLVNGKHRADYIYNGINYQIDLKV